MSRWAATLPARTSFAAPWVEDLEAAGFAAAVNPTVMRTKGAKCLGNLANAVTAITGSHRGAATFMARVRDEARRVWRAAGIEFEESEDFASRRGTRYQGSDRWPRGHTAHRAAVARPGRACCAAPGSIEKRVPERRGGATRPPARDSGAPQRGTVEARGTDGPRPRGHPGATR